MEWYKKLTLHQKINIKGELMGLLCGIEFEQLSFMFSFKERMDIIYNKLQKEGFSV